MKENKYKDFGQVVRDARIRSRLTQEALAEILNISTTHLKTIESGQRNPSFPLLKKIVYELNISLDALFLKDKCNEEAIINEISHMLKKCDENQLQMLKYMINGLLFDK